MRHQKSSSIAVGCALLLSMACAATTDAVGNTGASGTSGTSGSSGSGGNSGSQTIGSDSGANGVCSPGQTRSCDDACGDGKQGSQKCVLSGEFGAWGACTCECVSLCDGAHTECDCTAAGASVVDIGESCRICRFDAPACPDSWANYQDWRTTVDGTDCGGVVQQATTGAGGAEEECPPFVPFVVTTSGHYMLSCDRKADYCCGTPPSAAAAVPFGKPWSSHAAEVKSFSQGYNPCGCACGPEHCTTKEVSCVAPTTQIGCA